MPVGSVESQVYAARGNVADVELIIAQCQIACCTALSFILVFLTEERKYHAAVCVRVFVFSFIASIIKLIALD